MVCPIHVQYDGTWCDACHKRTFTLCVPYEGQDNNPSLRTVMLLRNTFFVAHRLDDPRGLSVYTVHTVQSSRLTSPRRTASSFADFLTTLLITIILFVHYTDGDISMKRSLTISFHSLQSGSAWHETIFGRTDRYSLPIATSPPSGVIGCHLAGLERLFVS